jgi:hypothetical protein
VPKTRNKLSRAEGNAYSYYATSSSSVEVALFQNSSVVIPFAARVQFHAFQRIKQLARVEQRMN